MEIVAYLSERGLSELLGEYHVEFHEDECLCCENINLQNVNLENKVVVLEPHSSTFHPSCQSVIKSTIEKFPDTKFYVSGDAELRSVLGERKNITYITGDNLAQIISELIYLPKNKESKELIGKTNR